MQDNLLMEGKVVIDKFKVLLSEEGKSATTIKVYVRNVLEYKKWYEDSFSLEFKMLHRDNILEYISYMKNVKKLKYTSINQKISSLIKFNQDMQDHQVVFNKDRIKIQEQTTSLATVSKEEVNKFRQQVLEGENKRNYAIVSIMMYAGLRISEVLDVKVDDFNLESKELIVKGKGNKARIVYLNDKIINALRVYLKEEYKENENGYLFVSTRGNRLDNSVVNKLFNKYSDKITPHTLRHFFCSRAVEVMSIHEVATLAGHSNINTTLRYTNATVEEMKNKVNLI